VLRDIRNARSTTCVYSSSGEPLSPLRTVKSSELAQRRLSFVWTCYFGALLHLLPRQHAGSKVVVKWDSPRSRNHCFVGRGFSSWGDVT
jgi:hypothetical protein